MANPIINRSYTDLDLNFTSHPVRKDVNIHKDEKSVIYAIKNILLTNHYEKPFQPDVGSNIRRMLFEPLDIITASNIEREIIECIDNYEPRVRIITLQVVPDYDNNAFGVFMEFNIINRTEPITINFLLERIR
jgi:phage baseplate assembly protein W